MRNEIVVRSLKQMVREYKIIRNVHKSLTFLGTGCSMAKGTMYGYMAAIRILAHNTIGRRLNDPR